MKHVFLVCSLNKMHSSPLIGFFFILETVLTKKKKRPCLIFILQKGLGSFPFHFTHSLSISFLGWKSLAKTLFRPVNFTFHCVVMSGPSDYCFICLDCSSHSLSFWSFFCLTEAPATQVLCCPTEKSVMREKRESFPRWRGPFDCPLYLKNLFVPCWLEQLPTIPTLLQSIQRISS